MSRCNIVVGDPAISMVSDAQLFYTNLAQQSYQLAQQAVMGLNTVAIRPVDFTVNFDFDQALTTFRRPDRPNVDFSRFDLRTPEFPAAAPQFAPAEIALDAAPVLNAVEPVLRNVPQPQLPAFEAPGAAPRFDAPTMPEAPEYTMPELPTMERLNLPSVPSIQLPTFNAAAPREDFPAIADVFEFSPERYVSDLLERTKANISRMQQGGTGLPAAIERALFERGRARIDEEEVRAVQQAVDEFGTRGFSEPNGVLAARLHRVHQEASNRATEVSRDVQIRAQDVEIENLRFAVQQGVGLETALYGLAIEEQRIALAAATFARDSAIQLLNARIAVFNARMQGYQTEAQVFAERIRGELAKAEVYRAQIEGERARGEINTQSVQLYAEQVRTVGVLADVYRTQVQAVQAQSETNRTVIEGYRAEVQAYGERLRAYTSEWEGYRAAIDGERARVDAYDTSVRAYATRVQVWNGQQDVKFRREQLRIAQNGQQLQTWEADLRKSLALLQSESARISSYGLGVQASASMYQADSGVAQAESEAHDRTFQLGLERERARVDTQLQLGQARVQENIQLLQLLTRVRETLAQVSSQLAASTMSAVNFSASIGSSRSASESCSTNFSFNGEIADA